MSSVERKAVGADRQRRPVMVMATPAADPAISRWADEAHWQLLSFHKGRVVQRTPNGLVMEFADARSCVQAAFALRESSPATSLRAAAHLGRGSGDTPRDGADVKLASGLTEVARPGEVLLTAELRDLLADGLDAEFEDMGYCRPRPSGRPVRVFRAHSERSQAPEWSAMSHRDLRPGLAVVPFKGGFPEVKHWMVGELIAAGVIERLSHSIGLRVISRQSTSVFRGRENFAAIEQHLGAAFVLSGTYAIRGKRLVVHAELAESRTHALLWTGELQHPLDDLVRESSQLLHELAHRVATVLEKAHVRKALAQPLPSMQSSYLMMAGIAMTHSHSEKTFKRARAALEEVLARHPDLALPKAWLGMWHALNVVKGQSADVRSDTVRALELASRALDVEPGNAMGLAVEGYVFCQLLGNPERARKSLNTAIENNPSEPMGWLFKSLYSGMWGSSSAAVTEAYMARSLSPVDPLRYFFDLLTANAFLADRRYEDAIEYGRKSLRANSQHVPTLRMLLMAQAESGRLEEARETLARLLALNPRLTVSSYLAMGGADSPMRQRCANALRLAGLAER